VKAKGGVDTCGVLDQLTLARFITSGAYGPPRPLRPPAYRRRRDTLVDASPTRPDVHVTGIAAGLHAVLSLPPAPNSQWSKPPPGRAALHTLSSTPRTRPRAPWTPWLWATHPVDHAWRDGGGMCRSCR